ncbi:MAG: L-glutamate gamma-semialdehyde dehydrogenase [Bdellovibrionota bacterium]
MKEFQNEAFTDFTNDLHASEIKKAIASVQSELGKTYPNYIGGKTIECQETFASINPSQKEQVVGIFPKATTEHIDQAVDSAWQAYETWSKEPVAVRAQILFDAARLMRERKHQFSSWMMFETGKTWIEADADTAEAIDFMEFYGREMLRLAKGQELTKIPTEENELSYRPLGVGAVIPPWNFPLAICVGMTTAAVVSGNTVVLKPSSDAPTVAYQFVELMREVGLPKGVINFVTGSGRQIGDHLTSHPKIRFISFTGSKEVGLRINELAAKTNPKQKWIKRVVAEMGGKDAIVVDKGANVDEVATGIVAAAFGFQGQKCSACSRAIIVEDLYEEVVEAVIEKTKQLKMGNPWERETQIGPVISSSAFEKITQYIEIGKKEGSLVLGGNPTRNEGYFIEPTVIRDVPNEARISKEEIFGPVLALTKAKDFDQALAYANDTDFGLTGAVYSNNPDHLEKARQDYFVGNLYLNRKCTGALVGVHPFGGFNMSGTDSKAGGKDYLLLFTQAKLISKKIV